MIYIVGLGPGSEEYILPIAVKTLNKCEKIIGFKRALESLHFIEKEKYEVKSINDILTFLHKNQEPSLNIAVVASGDPCFYGITDFIKRNYKVDLKVIPGLSSFQYLCAKGAISWNGAYVGSMHGREENFIETVKNHELSLWLTDKKNSPKVLMRKLMDNAMKCQVIIGENLSYEEERIVQGEAQDFIEEEFSDLCVVVIKNEIHKG